MILSITKIDNHQGYPIVVYNELSGEVYVYGWLNSNYTVVIGRNGIPTSLCHR